METDPKYVTFDGLDATGKSTLVEMLKSEFGADMLKTPPDWIRPVRKIFDGANVGIRFSYYVYGNLWADKNILRPMLANCQSGLILQDRSWLSTLSAHELRGLPKLFLGLGFLLAKSCVQPDTSFIVHVDREERRSRLTVRGIQARSDMENYKYEDSMEVGYQNWGARLGWNVETFDNTRHTTDSALIALKRRIGI